jgi:outer membrane protein assembly factor BamB
MKSIQLLTIFSFIIILTGGVSSVMSGSDRNLQEESLTNIQINHRAFYGYNSVYNHSEQYQFQKKSRMNYYSDLSFKKQEIISNNNFNTNLKENPDNNISFLLNNGLMDPAWPMTSHDAFHTGRSPYNTTCNPDGVEIWRFTSDCVQGGPIVDKNGTIYFGSYDNNFYALFPNGTLKWKTLLNRVIASTPAIDKNGIIYIGTIWNSNYLFALYSNNGTVKWSYYTGNDIDSSPAIGTDGTIYFGDWNGWIHALNPNGTLKWKYLTGNVVTGSPAIGLDGTVYCGSHDNKLYAFYPNNGTVKWTFQTGDWVRVSPCVGDDGTVYCVSLDSYLYAIYPGNGTMKWCVSVGAGTNPTIGRDGTIYCGYSYLCAVRPNGSIKWIFNPGAGRSIRGSTPCASAEGIIYFGTSDGGEVIAVNPDGTERWRNIFEHYESAPAIGKDGTIYIGCCSEDDTSGYIRAFGSINPNAPTAPTITGQTNGKIKKTYTYTFTSTSPLGHNIYYLVDWGDGTTTDWLGPYNSGTTLTLNHSWQTKGTYLIQARAKDTDNLWGPWGSLSVTMPCSYDVPFMNLFDKILERFPHAFPILRYILHQGKTYF